MMDARTINELTSDILNSIDFSKVTLTHRSEINFNMLPLGDVPCADMDKFDEAADSIRTSMDGVKQRISESRLCEPKKYYAMSACDSIDRTLEQYAHASEAKDVNGEKWECLNHIRQLLETLSKNSSSTVKDDVQSALSCAKRIERDYGDIMVSREYFLSHLGSQLIEHAHDFRVSQYEKELEGKELTLDLIRANDGDTAYKDAICQAAYKRYCDGVELVRAIIHQGKESLPVLSWVFSQYVADVVRCANDLGVKTFAFHGHSSAALEDLCELSKFSASFRFETVEREYRGCDCLAIVTLP